MIKNFNNNKILLIALEHKSGLEVKKRVGEFELFKSKKFGKTTISYYNLKV